MNEHLIGDRVHISVVVEPRRACLLLSTTLTRRKHSYSNPRRIAVALTLSLWPWNPQTMSFLRYLKVIPYTKFKRFGSFVF